MRACGPRSVYGLKRGGASEIKGKSDGLKEGSARENSVGKK